MKDVVLHRDLQRRLYKDRRGKLVLHHPLLSQPYVPRFNAVYNRLYDDKRAEAAQAKRAKDWARFIWLHEQPFRVHIFQDIAPQMGDDEYWRMLADVWLDSDNLFQNRKVWAGLWSAEREHRGQVMRPKEHELLAKLPDEVTIYRGCRDRRSIYGLSWTTERSLASWFANRYAPDDRPPLLAVAWVRKKHIKALFSERRENETEVVVLPQHCRDLDLQTLPVRKRRAA
jgi:hypothetical protein